MSNSTKENRYDSVMKLGIVQCMEAIKIAYYHECRCGHKSCDNVWEVYFYKRNFFIEVYWHKARSTPRA